MKQFKDFNKLEYKRVDYNDTKNTITILVEKLKNAQSFNEFLDYFKEIINIQNRIEEMYDYADIRNMRDSSDEFYQTEMDYWNNYKTKFDSLFNPFYETVLNSKYKSELSSFVPKTFFLTIEYEMKVKKDTISELSSREKELEGKYRSIVREKVSYNGETITLSELAGYLKSSDRTVRKEASASYNDFFYSKKDELDKVFIELIRVRKSIAQKLGFKSYKEYSLYKLRRFGYNYEDIKLFRNNVINFIIPIIKDTQELKKALLGLDKIEYYDDVMFESPAMPLYKDEKLLEKYGDCLKEVDETLYELYINMLKNGYIDFLRRDNKVGFNITNYLCCECLPVITGTLKNTYYDVTAISHELGHSFQKYNASLMDNNYIVSSVLKYPTMEVAEMFSYAMQVLLLPHLSSLFDEPDYNKYAFQVMYDLISLLPYMCLVDEFQEKVYDTEALDSEKIHKIWPDLVKRYSLVYLNKGHINLDSGCYFFRQNHIFLSPFYYIDYAISTVGALVIAESCKDNLDVFKNTASVASYFSIKNLSDYNLPDPFKEENVAELSKKLKNSLHNYYQNIKKEKKN